MVIEFLTYNNKTLEQKIKAKDLEIKNIKSQLFEITSSKNFKLWQKYNQFKKIIKIK